MTEHPECQREEWALSPVVSMKPLKSGLWTGEWQGQALCQEEGLGVVCWVVEPQGDLRLEASWEAFGIVHTTKWEHTDLAEYRAPERERMDKRELPGCGE